jgi:hypothetical protein
MDPDIRQYLKKQAAKGGRARAAKLTKAERRASAQQAARARWGTRRKEG